MTTTDPIILLVDDSPNDAMLMRTVFQRAGFMQPLQYAVDGDDAIAYLRGDGRYADRNRFPLPTTVLMDLNMPRKDGFEVLDWIRHQPTLRRLRVYILSASSRPQDIDRAYELGVNSYLVKPGRLDELIHLAKCLCAWLKVSHFAPVIEESESRSPFATSDSELHATPAGYQLAH